MSEDFLFSRAVSLCARFLQRQDRRRPQKPNSLYDPKIATMEGEAPAYDQSDATGFIRLNAFRLKIRAAPKKVRNRK